MKFLISIYSVCLFIVISLNLSGLGPNWELATSICSSVQTSFVLLLTPPRCMSLGVYIHPLLALLHHLCFWDFRQLSFFHGFTGQCSSLQWIRCSAVLISAFSRSRPSQLGGTDPLLAVSDINKWNWCVSWPPNDLVQISWCVSAIVTHAVGSLWGRCWCCSAPHVFFHKRYFVSFLLLTTQIFHFWHVCCCLSLTVISVDV